MTSVPRHTMRYRIPRRIVSIVGSRPRTGRWYELGLLVGLLLYAVTATAAEPAWLRYRSEPGEVWSYRFRAEGTSEVHLPHKTLEFPIRARSIITQRALQVNSDDTVTFDIELTDTRIATAISGETIKVPVPPVRIRVVVDPLGRLVRTDAPVSSSANPAPWKGWLHGLLPVYLPSLVFPAAPIQVGESWRTEQSQGSPAGKWFALWSVHHWSSTSRRGPSRLAQIETQTDAPYTYVLTTDGLTSRMTTTNRIQSTTTFDLDRGRIISIDGTLHSRQTVVNSNGVVVADTTLSFSTVSIEQYPAKTDELVPEEDHE